VSLRRFDSSWTWRRPSGLLEAGRQQGDEARHTGSAIGNEIGNRAEVDAEKREDVVMSQVTRPIEDYTAKDFKSDLKPDLAAPRMPAISASAGEVSTARWPASGRAPPRDRLRVGIGCSRRIPGYTTAATGFNQRSATRARPCRSPGHQLANPDLLVLVAGGDGDGFSIGGGHVAHAIRRNIDLTVHRDGQPESTAWTKGQLSPTSRAWLQTVTSSLGSMESP